MDMETQSLMESLALATDPINVPDNVKFFVKDVTSIFRRKNPGIMVRENDVLSFLRESPSRFLDDSAFVKYLRAHGKIQNKESRTQEHKHGRNTLALFH